MKDTIKKSIIAAISVLIITVGLAMGLYTCSTGNGGNETNNKGVNWEKELDGQLFELNGSNYSCPIKNLEFNDSVVIMTMDSGDKIEGSFDGNKIIVGDNNYDVRFSDKDYSLRLSSSSGYADYKKSLK